MSETAWAAGVLEGEGCFSIFQRKTGSKTKTCAIHLEMTDEDIVYRVANIFNVGKVNKRLNISGRTERMKRKPSWCWSVQNREGVKKVLTEILPYLGKRRTEKAMEILDTWK